MKSLADINNKYVRRVASIFALPVVLLTFTIDCLFGIWELGRKNVKQFVWMWKMPSGKRGQKAPDYPDQNTEPIRMEDMTQEDVVAALEELEQAGVDMPELSPEKLKAAQIRLDKKLLNITSMKEAVEIMIADIQEHKAEDVEESKAQAIKDTDKAYRASRGLPSIDAKDVPPMPKVKDPKADEAKDDYDEVAPGYVCDKGTPHVVEDPHEVEEAEANEPKTGTEFKIDENGSHKLKLTESDSPEIRLVEETVDAVAAQQETKVSQGDRNAAMLMTGKSHEVFDDKVKDIAAGIAAHPTNTIDDAAASDFEEKLEAVRKAPHTKDELEEIKRQTNDIARARQIKTIETRRVRAYLADIVLDNAADQLGKVLKDACKPLPGMMYCPYIPDFKGPTIVNDQESMDKAMGELREKVAATAELQVADAPTEEKLPGMQVADQLIIKQAERDLLVKAEELVEHANETKQVKPDDLSEGGDKTTLGGPKGY